MADAGLITLYNNLFKISFVITILGIGLAVFFFYYFDIRTVYALMTGKAKRETIQRMAEQNAKTGNLRNQFVFTGQTGQTGKTGKTGKTGRRGFTGNLTQEIHHTIQQPQAPAEAETTYLADDGQMQTTVLADDQQMQTTVLVQEDPASAQTAMLARSPGQYRFVMTENTLVIHTDEII